MGKREKRKSPEESSEKEQRKQEIAQSRVHMASSKAAF